MNSGASWPKYTTFFDCSTGICNIYCPQWCYITSPPPPPPQKYYHRPLSPLLISLIALFSTAILLLTYFSLFLTRFCRTRPTSQNPHENNISSIAVCTYTRSTSGSSLVGGATDCAVCLGEFEEEESLRILPICNHAFHLPCIDAWIKSNSTCPLCRSSIFPPPSHSNRLSSLLVCSRDDVVTVEDRTNDVVVVFEVSDKAEDGVVDFPDVCTGHGAASASIDSSSICSAEFRGCV